ncbi:MAG: helix-turn-helix domain-containing protein [Sphingomonas sp.]|nr:helix-turn-helix domain-containing protein [Pirellulales bacterium]MBX9859751.1 helix-turn-helix domain-containing protein [Sphingomonas sp.]
MDTMERDPLYIAEQVKFIRKMHPLTQDNLADASGLSTRTIEKVESGRHRPDEQTLRSIARAAQVDVSFFEKPTPQQEDRRRAETLRAQRKTVVAPINPVRTARDFLGAFLQREAFTVDTSAVTDEAALDVAAAMADWVRDCGDIWDDCYMSQRLDYAREFVKLGRQLEELGYFCYMGSHRMQLRQKDQSRLIFTVGLMTVLPKEGSEGTRYAVIQLEGAWESLEEDRVSLS